MAADSDGCAALARIRAEARPKVARTITLPASSLPGLKPASEIEDTVEYGDICERAISLGLGLCSPEVAPAMRLNSLRAPYRIPRGKWILVASNPVHLYGKRHVIFGMGSWGGAPRLDVYDANPHDRYRMTDFFTFVLPGDTSRT